MIQIFADPLALGTKIYFLVSSQSSLQFSGDMKNSIFL